MRLATLFASVLFGLAAVTGARADVKFTPATPAAQSFHVGTLSLTALHDAQIIVANDGKTFGLGVSPRAVANVLRAAGAPSDKITLSANALLVRTGARVILIDTGLGPRSGALLRSLALTGLSPGEVTDVLITHPHSDHIGGLLDAQGGLAFPKATIRMASAAWDWMKQTAPPAMVNTVAPRIRTFQPGAAIAPGVRSVSLPGHTPGHVGYEIVSAHSRLIDTGDVAHSSIVSLARPQWAIEFDSDRSLGRETRVATLAALAKSREWVFAPHFPFPGVGHIVAAGKGYVWRPGLP
jgi:glyoxylase-like metal-dependent hydrolase (beta-lactamase superfamily II)